MKDFYQDIYKKDPKKITKKDAKKFMEMPCYGRGEHLLNAEREALRFGNAEGIKRLKEEMRKFGCPVNFKKIDPLDWYPLGWRVLTFIALKKILI